MERSWLPTQAGQLVGTNEKRPRMFLGALGAGNFPFSWLIFQFPYVFSIRGSLFRSQTASQATGPTEEVCEANNSKGAESK